MKKITILLLITLVSNVCFSQSVNQFDSNGKRHGIWKKYFDQTQILRYEGEFNHGKEIGVFKFYKNIEGKSLLTATRTFSPSSDIASVQFLSVKGKVISEGKMRSKTYVGKWVYFHKNSLQIMMEEFYNNKGELEGERKTYYLSGKLAENAKYKSGLLDGESKWFSETGKMIRLFTYQADKLQGPAKSYDASGKLEMEGVYRNDKKHGVWKYYKKGKLEREKDFTRRSKNPYKKKQ